jgi:hypothetical protein
MRRPASPRPIEGVADMGRLEEFYGPQYVREIQLRYGYNPSPGGVSQSRGKLQPGQTTIKLEGTLGAPNEDGPFRAKVIGLDTDEKGTTKIVLAAESKPLETVDAALELLLVLHNPPQKIREMAAEWPDATVAK